MTTYGKRSLPGVQLERVLLHNWYRYEQQIVEFGDTTLITGATGTGKSVINDALLYSLTTARTFNQASGNSNKGGKRTLFTYIRGYTGNGYLRADGSVTGYIMLEFRNKTTDRRFLLVTAIESRKATEETTTTERYVVYDDVADIKLEDVIYMNEGVERFSYEVDVMVNGKTQSLKKYKTNDKTEYFSQVTRLFGESFDYNKFVDTLKKAMAYKQDMKLDDFLKDILFGQREVNVADCIGPLEGITRLENIIKLNQKKLDMLDPIIRNINKYEDLKEQARISEIAKAYSLTKYAEEDTEKKKKELESAQHNLSVKKAEFTDLQRKQEQIEGIIQSLNRELYSSGQEQGREKLEAVIKEKKMLLRIEDEKCRQLEKDIRSLHLADGISADLDQSIKRFEESLYSDEDSASLYDSLSAVHKDLFESYNRKRFDIQKDIERIGSRRVELSTDYARLKSGNSVASHKVTAFLEYAKSRAKEEGRIINPCVLADVISDIDKDWQPWIEAELGAQREAILCDRQDYLFIKPFLKLDEFRGVKVLNYSAIRGKIWKEKNSLAEKIQTENTIARAFLDFKLARIVICDEQELEYHNHSITIDGLRYNGYMLTSLTPVKRYCLGRKAMEAEKKRLQDEIGRLTRMIHKKEGEKKETLRVFNILDACRPGKDHVYTTFNAFQNAKALQEELRSLEESLNELLQDPTIIMLQQRIGQMQEEKKKHEDLKIEASYQVRKLEESIEVLSAGEDVEGSLANLAKDLREKEEAFNSFSDEDQEKAKEMLEKKDKRSYRNRTIQWDKHKQDMDAMFFTINKAIASFAGKYKEEDFGTGEEQFAHYKELKDKLYAKNTIEAVNGIQNYKNEFKKNFQVTMISKLYSNILWAKTFRKELNIALEKIHFGKDQYKIIIKNTTDEEKKKLLNMIIKIGKNVADDPEFAKMSMKDREMAEEFCEMIISRLKEVDTDHRDKELEAILDYRTYLDFDVEVNEGISLKKKGGSNSGGEAQTAYYVILAASFYNIYSPDSVKLVMIDEAFDKIDESRKSEVLQFFTNFGFQCIITTPSIAPFLKHADTVVSVVSNQRIAYAKSQGVNHDTSNTLLFKKGFQKEA